MVTSRDVARLAGVSQATVSRVLRDSPQVRAATRERVLKALAQVDYTPNAMARAMRTRRTQTIGVVVGSITNPFYPEVLEALSVKLAAVEHRMILWVGQGPGEESAIAAIRECLADGLIFTTATQDSPVLAEALRRRTPIVLINREVDRVECDQVASDNATGGRQVAEYFLANGHRRIGMIGGWHEWSTGRERERGFRQGLREPLSSRRYRMSDYGRLAGFRAAQDLMDGPDRPTAIFCVNDLVAFGAMDGVRAMGFRVPEDVWIVGYDDIEMSSWETFDLTTMSQPSLRMVEDAVDLLLARIHDPTRPTVQRRLESRLIVRGSTAASAMPEAASG